MKYKKTILMDLDGVLNNYTYFDEKNIPSVKEGVVEFLEKLYTTEEYEIII